ncbi:lytic transglycosylase domain-containing protein [Aceticella autotrophica]|uniref:Lytic transglycosylase domain-containing protein n=1 Tax=Aceticella autotrophica TaxID=2755338 RepID=A0A975AWN6_9THEO|nr:lytic transglycosylase domain-containing protein [Aceticella autotrophica]QSZ27862.1 lytic transglycosylase domain-containing protein [Aceticella autotrophica]
MIFKKAVAILILIIILLIGYAAKTNWFLKQMYPQKYKEQVIYYSKFYDVDPNLVFAVIKAESNFNPRVVSKNNAIGLMQVLPDTGSWAAKNIGIKGYTTNMLYEPNYNIQIGTWYLSYLLKEFDNNIILAVAAYNGGSGNVKKWLRNKQYSTNGSHLENIPFPETDIYLSKVMKNYRIYTNLYKQQ